ncbi:NFIL3 like protein [Manis javanica]|uniref:NFIL3 like protein n=1 Tax=Manis javanica TaxID=9974 RepID=UPI003C6D769A
MDLGLPGLPAEPQGPGKDLRAARGRGAAGRRQREFVPAERKDAAYWQKRRENNAAARRSREKRRLGDAALGRRLAALLEENTRLRAELCALRPRGGPPAALRPPPWAGDPQPGAGPPPSLRGPHGRLLRPCSLDAGLPGCGGCLVARGWAGLATSPGSLQDPVLAVPRRTDMALQPAPPDAFFGCHLVGGCGGPRPSWGLWPHVSPDYQASGPSGVLGTPTADPRGLPPRVACPEPRNGPEGLSQNTLPHKRRTPSPALGGVPLWGEAGRGAL